MDRALVCIILTSVAENNPSGIQHGEPAQVVAWLTQRIRIARPDKGGGTVYNPEMATAARAAEEAFALFSRGEVEAAKPLALEALSKLGG